MSDATSRDQCPRCGEMIPANAPSGFCPRCFAADMVEGDETTAGGEEGKETKATGRDATGEGANGQIPGRFVAPPVEDIDGIIPGIKVEAFLGQGGMGAVYKGVQTELDREVAIKVLPLELTERDPSFSERFRREARAMAKLSHPNIVTVYDFGRTDLGHCYFVMEFVDGADLRQMLRSGGCSPSVALTIVPKVCEALQFAHDRGVLHRDIKPENILLDKHGTVKLTDFGLAKLVGDDATRYSLTLTGTALGTPNYLAPEQMELDGVTDHRADIYSLGVVLYELLTGSLPRGAFQPPSERSAEVDSRIDQVVLRAMQSEPERRYQQISEVKTDIDHIQSGPPVAEPVVASPGRAPATAKPAMAPSAGTLIVCPECQSSIPETSPHCPECGLPSPAEEAKAILEAAEAPEAAGREEITRPSPAVGRPAAQAGLPAAAAAAAVDDPVTSPAGGEEAENQQGTRAWAITLLCAAGAFLVVTIKSENSAGFAGVAGMLIAAQAVWLRNGKYKLFSLKDFFPRASARVGHLTAWILITGITLFAVFAGLLGEGRKRIGKDGVVVFNDPTPTEHLSPFDPYGDGFGKSVAFSDQYLAIGAPRHRSSKEAKAGQVHVFDMSSGDSYWLIDSPNPDGYELDFGQSIAISGGRLLVGSRGEKEGMGRAYLYDLKEKKLLRSYDDPTPTEKDNFGSTVAMDGDYVLIGADYDDTLGDGVGQAHLFSAETGELLHTLNDPDPTSRDWFGMSVAIHGDRVLIGSAGHVSGSGRAHLFSARTGELIRNFSDPSGGYMDFGWTVALHEDLVLVGAPGSVDGATGNAYLFDADSGDLLRTFRMPSPTEGDRFGDGLAITGTYVLIGAPRHGKESRYGVAYLFDRENGKLLKTYRDASPTEEGKFGEAVATDGKTVVVGAPNDSTKGEKVGQVYLWGIEE